MSQTPMTQRDGYREARRLHGTNDRAAAGHYAMLERTRRVARVSNKHNLSGEAYFAYLDQDAGRRGWG